MNHKILNTLKFTGFFVIGVILFWLVYKDQDVDRIKSILKNDVQYFWIWVSLVLGLLSHLSRTIRWNYMIEPLGKKPRLLNTFLSLMVGYLMNLVVPRMGEISRCGVLSRYEKISFTKLIGTVVTERIIDVLSLLLLTFLVTVFQFGKIIQFLENNPEVRHKFEAILFSPYVWAFLFLSAFLLWYFRRKVKDSEAFHKLQEIMEKFGEGLKSIRTMQNKWAFIFHSVFIWVMYFLMMYVVFFSFGFTRHLSMMAGLTTFVLGSYGMVAPVQGGIGAWHFMVMQSLFVYGVAKADGSVFALLAHSTMTAMLIVLGLVSWVLLPIVNRATAKDGPVLETE